MPPEDEGLSHPTDRWFAYWDDVSESLKVYGPHVMTWAPTFLERVDHRLGAPRLYVLLGWWNFPPGTAHREAARELARLGLKLRPPEPET